MTKTQLLCTFTSSEQLEATLRDIVQTYDIAFDTIYVLENLDSTDSLCCTYNVNADSQITGNVSESTISLHRKKATNTLYTINALNLLVAELNNGKVDNRFQVPWENYSNAIMVTAYNRIKRIDTKLKKIVKVSEL